MPYNNSADMTGTKVAERRFTERQPFRPDAARESPRIRSMYQPVSSRDRTSELLASGRQARAIAREAFAGRQGAQRPQPAPSRQGVRRRRRPAVPTGDGGRGGGRLGDMLGGMAGRRS